MSWGELCKASWGDDVEREVRNRIRVSVATYAYEVVDKPIMSDHTWDFLAQTIRPSMGTCHPLIDEFFVSEFSPMTGLWIHQHPELDKVEKIFKRYYAVMGAEHFDRIVRR